MLSGEVGLPDTIGRDGMGWDEMGMCTCRDGRECVMDRMEGLDGLTRTRIARRSRRAGTRTSCSRKRSRGDSLFWGRVFVDEFVGDCFCSAYWKTFPVLLRRCAVEARAREDRTARLVHLYSIPCIPTAWPLSIVQFCPSKKHPPSIVHPAPSFRQPIPTTITRIRNPPSSRPPQPSPAASPSAQIDPQPW